MARIWLPLLIIAIPIASVSSQTPPAETLALWPAGPPEENGLAGPTQTGNGCISNISTATLQVFLPETSKANGKAIVVIPGGGYGVVCAETEGQQIAEILVPQGIAAIVLTYRLPNQHHRIPATDARRAIRTVRHHAQAWNIDPDHVGVWGFSAGGHLASTVSTRFDAGQADAEDAVERFSSRPDFSILFYPVISMMDGVTHAGSRRNLLGDASEALMSEYSNEQHVTAETPPTFLLHAADDRVVSLKNSLVYYDQLIKHGVASRIVLYETGGHGPTVFKSNPSWKHVFLEWMAKR